MFMTATPAMDDASTPMLPARPEPTPVEEANHRIANNLQLLSAMISIEARRIQDPAALAALDVTRQRITAIACVHRLLYQTHGVGTVNLATYLGQLGGKFSEVADRQVVVDAHAVLTTADEAAAIGIIVSELVTNAWKYAYAVGEPGGVRIVLRGRSAKGYRLEVEDRGRGRLAPGGQEAGLGTELIRLLAARLGGACVYHDARPGTRIVLEVSMR